MKTLNFIFYLLLFPFLVLKGWISATQTMKSTLSISFSTLALFFLLTGSVQASVPIADAGSDQTVAIGDTVNLNGSGSSDADNDTLTYIWTITSSPSGSSAVLSDSGTIVNPTFTADKLGSYVVTLVVHDGVGSSIADSITIYTSLDFLPDLYIYCSPLSTFENGSIDLGGTIIVIGTDDGNVTTPSLSGTGTCKDTASSTGVTCDTDGNFVDPITTIPTDHGTSSDSEQTLCNISDADQEYGAIKCTDADSTYDNAIIRINGTLDLSASGYTLTIKNNVEIHTSGEIKLMVDQIIFETDATLTIYSDAKVTFGSHTVTTPSSMPPNNFKIYTAGEIITGSDSTINALLYSSSIVTLGSNSTLNGSVTAHDIKGGSDSTVDATTIENCGGGSTINYVVPFFVDAVDTSYSSGTYTDTNGPDIQTKVSFRSGYNFDAVYLGLDNTGVESYSGNDNLPLTVQITLADSNCSKEYLWDTTNGGEPVGVAQIPHLQDSATLNETVDIPAIVGQDMRLLLRAIDWFGHISSFDVSNSCYVSSTTGNLCGVMGCLGALEQAEEAFPVNTSDSDINANNRRIMTDCYGVSVNNQGTPIDETDDTVDGSIGDKSPCNSNNYNGSCGGDKDDIDPDKYQHKYGCLSCILDTGYGIGCSVDHFAIRPDHFVLSMTDPDFPNLLRAGEGYGVALTAYDDADVLSNDFNVSNFNNNLDTNATQYFKDGTEDTSDLLHGEPDLNNSAVAYSVGGFSRETNTSGAAQEIIDLSYDDVGRVNVQVYDYRWAAIDDDDTNTTTCDDTIPHTRICGDKNVTFIPHHFGFAELNITNHAGPDSNFTYIANERGMPVSIPDPTRSPMASRIQARIEARNKDGGITRNFRTEATATPYDTTLYYENNVSITIKVVVPSSGTNQYLYPNADESNVTNSIIGFGRGGTDDNGTRNVLWNEADFPLEFNFPRTYNDAANPFDVNGSYLNIELHSIYTDASTPSSPADINGSRVGDNNATAWTACATDNGCIQQNADANATFMYGRAIPSEDPYDDVNSPVNTPILVYVYCDPDTITCSDYNLSAADGARTIEYNWWLSLKHNMTTDNYGDIELKVGSVTPSGTATVTTAPSVTIDANAKDENVFVAATSTNRTMTVNIDLVVSDTASFFTHRWLIYNPDSNTVPSPFYRVLFIGHNDWAGHGDTGHVVDSDISSKKNRRLGW